MKYECGFFFFSDWEKGMRKLTGKDFKKLFWALYDFQLNDIKPPEFKGDVDILASLIIPQIKRRKDKARAGSLGGIATQKNAREKALLQGVENDSLLDGLLEAKGQAHNKNININTNNYINKKSTLASVACPSDTARFQDGAGNAGEKKSEGECEKRDIASEMAGREYKGSFDTQTFFDAAVRRSLGDSL